MHFGGFLTSKNFFNELCWGKVMITCPRHIQGKREESKRLRGEGDQIEFIDLRLERWQVEGLGN